MRKLKSKLKILITLCLVILMIPFQSLFTLAENPIVQTIYTADPAPMVDGDTLYVYTSHDEDGSTYFTMDDLMCYSTTDMVNWTDHGLSLIHIQMCIRDRLTADSPTGPFTDPLGHALIDRNTPNCSNQDVPWLFDPAVFVDDDGTGYLYFGGGIDGLDANNPCSARAVQLGDDMISIVGEPVEIDAPRLFEDSGMHKYNGIYYYSYCSNFSGQSGEGYPPTGTIAVSYTHLLR